MKQGLKVRVAAGIFACAALAAGLAGLRVLEKQNGWGSTVVLDLKDSQPQGAIKPLHGVNNGPVSGYQNGTWQLDASSLYREAGIPFVRTHDTEYPYGHNQFVDIHCIFPDFSRDPDDPSAYVFEKTDLLMESVTASGAQVVFRLGESIDYSGEDYYIRPPDDMQKWAEVCEHIVRHYNQGWADGFAYQIQFWEIWNEPENPAMWTGTMEQYAELYCLTARHLKQTHPEIQVGCGGMLSGEALETFLKEIRAQPDPVPLDFASCHRYSNDPSSYFGYLNQFRAILNQYGFSETSIALTEWNYLTSWEDLPGTWQIIQSNKGASFAAAALMVMQNAPADMAMYYDGQYAFADAWCGLYDRQGNPEPSYAAFRWFQKLYQMGSQIEADLSGQTEDIYVLAASGQGCTGVMMTFYRPEEKLWSAKTKKIRVNFPPNVSSIQVTVISETYPEGITYTVEGNAIVLQLELYDMAYLEAM